MRRNVCCGRDWREYRGDGGWKVGGGGAGETEGSVL